MSINDFSWQPYSLSTPYKEDIINNRVSVLTLLGITYGDDYMTLTLFIRHQNSTNVLREVYFKSAKYTAAPTLLTAEMVYSRVFVLKPTLQVAQIRC